MSAAGDILDALATIAVAQVATLTAANTERALYLSSPLNTEQLPHLFIHNPDIADDPLPYQQESRITTALLSLVTRGEGQEATLVKAEAIRAGIDADPTLGGLVQHTRVSVLERSEHVDSDDIEADLVVRAWEEL
jgi:hypothetical protein